MKNNINRCVTVRVMIIFIVLTIFNSFCNVWGIDTQADDSVVPLHDNVRTLPYPRAEHELYLNPPPLIVPSGFQTDDSLQFSLSQSPDFPLGSTINSKAVLWSMYSPNQILASGKWYWRYRSVGKEFTWPWSQTNSFTIKDETPKFATPPISTLTANIPTTYPRLYGFIQNNLVANRWKVTSFSEYKEMTSRAAGGLNWNYTSVTDLKSKINTMSLYVGFLYTAYQCTGDSKYTDKLLEFNRHLLSLTISENIVSNDFETGFYYLSIMLQSYDICCFQLTSSERLQIETRIITLAKKFYYQHVDFEEVHVYDNHFWQRTIYGMFQVGLLFHDKYQIAKEMLQYYYELWVTRGPVGGFSRDGQHFYSSNYFNLDMFGLYYMSGVLSFLTGKNFLEHPWYQHSGQALLYSWPALSKSGGFGDGNELNEMPYRTRIAFADYIGRETNSAYAQWYVKQCNALQSGSNILTSDYEYRMYRFAKMGQPYSNALLPLNPPNLLWFKDSGESMMHSDISDTQNDLFLSMRSSPYGAGSHTLADQNSFNLHYKGKPVYRSSGHYLNFSDKHNLLSYRHTQAHNSILVDGVGQAFTTRAFGNIVRTLDGKNISYSLGDASNAYNCISEYPLWQNAFNVAGISQTKEFGFGVTPLTKYRRHLFLLHPDKVLIYDELEASASVHWDWLLHSPVQFNIEESNKRIVLEKNMNPLSAIESGIIQNGCSILSFDFVQLGIDNVNLEIYVNDILVSTFLSSNERNIVKNTGSILVNISGAIVIRIKQKNATAGQVAIDNLTWESYVSTEVNDTTEDNLLYVNSEDGNIIATTSSDGQLRIYNGIGQLLKTDNIKIGQHKIQATSGVYIVRFIAEGKSDSKKVIVR